jgi:cytosine/adenosine deaminase-related metal-dependent hydrolase
MPGDVHPSVHTRVAAEWVLPISAPPIRNGAVAVAGGRVVSVGPAGPGTRHLGAVALLPALVNAHTHLELSHLHGRVPFGPTFVHWVRAQLALRRNAPEDPQAIADAARRALAAAVEAGTGLFGDVSNGLTTPAIFRATHVAAVVFHELLGFRGADAPGRLAGAAPGFSGWPSDDLRVSLAPHAPYSVSPALFTGIRRARDAAPDARTTVHLAESPEEVEFIRDGTGPWRAMLEDLGAWDPSWEPPRCSPVEYVASLGLLDDRVLAVHGVQCSPADIARLKQSGATLVVCPRSNRAVGVGDPPIQAFYDAGVAVAVGTDSLASAPDLNLFQELAAVRAVAPGVPARTILDSATRAGAAALGFPDRGHLTPGAAAAMIAVRLPAGVGGSAPGDVEECLLSGVTPDRVEWVWPPPPPAPTA